MRVDYRVTGSKPFLQVFLLFSTFRAGFYDHVLVTADFCPLRVLDFFNVFNFVFANRTQKFRLSVFTPVDLPLKLSVKGNLKPGLEMYSLQYCAWQFGLTQGIPMPNLYSMEYLFWKRNHFVLISNSPFECCHQITDDIFNPNPELPANSPTRGFFTKRT